MNNELRREVERWLRYAKEDVREAQRLADQTEAVPRHPAWMAQQAAEKALKAVLICEQIGFPYTHNLTTLFNLIPSGWEVKEVDVDLERLTEYAVESRYPGDFPDLTAAEAREAAEEATLIVEAVQHDVDDWLREA